VVKLDRALVQGLDKDKDKQKRLGYFVDLCTELGAAVVVEGVETEDELLAVRETGAPYVQGYLLARPSYPPPQVTFKPSWSGVKSQRPRPRQSEPGLQLLRGDDPLKGARPRMSAGGVVMTGMDNPPASAPDVAITEDEAGPDLFAVEPDPIEDRATPHGDNSEADYGALFGVMQEPEPETKPKRKR
jgi:hypothetical protein